jgi:hypothetical protein
MIKTAIEIANKWGIFAVIVCFFVWRADVRETELRTEMNRDREFTRDKLMETIRQNTAALNQCTTMMAAIANGGLQ